MIKRLLIFILLTLFSINIVNAVVTEQDSFKLVDSTIFSTSGGSIGQSFTVEAGNYTIQNASFDIFKIGSPPGTCTLALHANSGDLAGALLDTGDAISCSSFSVSQAFQNFTGLNFNVTNGTKYVLLVTNTGGHDGSNRLVFSGFTASNQYPLGRASGAGSLLSGNFDFAFITYGTDIVTDPIITFDNISLINNSVFNTTQINVSINLSVSNTNNQTDVFYILDNNPQINCFNNSLNGVCTISGLINGLHNVSFNASNNQTNTSSETFNFLIDLFPPTLEVNFPTELDSYTNFNISNFINISDNVSSIVSCIVIISGESNATCATTNYNFTSNANKTLNVIAIDAGGNSAFSLNNTLLVNPINFFQFNNGSSDVTSYTFGGRSDNGTGIVNFTTYNDGLPLGLNTLLFEKFGYVTQNFSFTTNTTNQFNTTFNVSAARIIVNIFNRLDGSVFTNSADVRIFGLGNLTTTTGQAVFQDFNFAAGDYEAEVVSTGFYTEHQTFTYSGESNASINIFLLDLSQNNTATLIVPTTDEWSNVLGGVDVRLQEYDPSILGFKQVSQCLSNSNGECQFLIEQNTKSYRIIGSLTINGILYTASNPLEENIGETFLPIISGGEEILGLEIIRQLKLKISESIPPANFLGLSITAPFTAEQTIVSTNDTATVINVPISFFAQSGLSYTVCFEVFVTTGNTFREVITPVCSTGASGLLPTANVILNNDFDYEARITVEFDGIKETFRTFLYPNEKSFGQILLSNGLVPNVVMFFWVLLLAFSMYLRNLALWSWGAMTLAVVQLGMFANLLVLSSSVIIIVINGCILYISRKQVDL